jgi:hypothetical protein
MAKEPALTFRLSKPDHFKCSLCVVGSESGRFSIDTDVRTMIEAFKSHVGEYHADEDVNQAAARIVREATETD